MKQARDTPGETQSRDNTTGPREPVPILVISLESAVSRRAQITAQMAQQGLTFEFVSAVTASAVREDRSLGQPASERTLRLGSGFVLGNAELACTLSHRKAYEQIVRLGVAGALILEDDAVLDPRFASFWHDLNLLSQNWDSHRRNAVVHCGEDESTGRPHLVLGRRSRISTSTAVSFSRVLRFSQPMWGTWAYFVTRAAAATLLKRPPDVADAWPWFIREGYLKEFWIAEPALVRHPKDPNQSLSHIQLDRASVPRAHHSSISAMASRLRKLGDLCLRLLFDPIAARLG